MTLKERRKRLGLTQAQVGKKLEVDQSAVAHWENNHCKPIKKYREKLAKLYGCTPDEINGA